MRAAGSAPHPHTNAGRQAHDAGEEGVARRGAVEQEEDRALRHARAHKAGADRLSAGRMEDATSGRV
eukprot:gene17151-biopygen789